MILSDSCCRFDLYQPLKIIQVPKICPFRKNRLKLDTSKYPANSQQGFANTKPRYRSKFRARPQTASNDKREALLGPKRESLDFQLQQLAQCHEANDDRGSLEIRSSLPHLYVRICPIKCESTLQPSPSPPWPNVFLRAPRVKQGTPPPSRLSSTKGGEEWTSRYHGFTRVSLSLLIPCGHSVEYCFPRGWNG